MQRRKATHQRHHLVPVAHQILLEISVMGIVGSYAAVTADNNPRRQGGHECPGGGMRLFIYLCQTAAVHQRPYPQPRFRILLRGC